MSSIKVYSALVPPRRYEEESVPASSQVFRGLLTIVGSPWFVPASPPSLSLSSCGIVSVHVCAYSPMFCKHRRSQIYDGSTLHFSTLQWCDSEMHSVETAR